MLGTSIGSAQPKRKRSRHDANTPSQVTMERLENRCLLSVNVPAYAHLIIDDTSEGPKRGPKGLADVTDNGKLDIIAYSPGQGTFWYENPSWHAYRMSAGDEGGAGSGTGEAGIVADVDGDGYPDFIASGLMWFQNPRAWGGDPHGLWAEHPILPIDDHDLAVADFNKDGRIDIAVVGGLVEQTAPDQWKLLDNATYFPNRGPHGAGTAVCDINGDGYADLLSTDLNGNLAWWENPTPGAGTIETAWTEHVIGAGSAGNANSMTGVDLNQDGRPDVVFDNPYGTGGLYWYEQPANPDAPWIEHTIDPSVAYCHQGSIVVADMNADGLSDLVITEQEQSPQKRVMIYFNEGGGASWTQDVLAVTGGINQVVGDLNGDGLPDIVSANHGYFGAPNPLEAWITQGSTSQQATINITAATRTASFAAPATVTVSRTGGDMSQALAMQYSIEPSAGAQGLFKISPTPGKLVFPAGQASVEIILAVTQSYWKASNLSVTITLQAQPGIAIGGTPAAQIELQAASPPVTAGFAASYYHAGFNGHVTAWRIDPVINFDFANNSSPPDGLSATDLAANWQGHITAPSDGTFVFYASAQGRIIAWINGEKILDHTGQGIAQIKSVGALLRKNRRYTLRIKYFGPVDGEKALVHLAWQSSGMKKTTVRGGILDGEIDTSPVALVVPRRTGNHRN